MKDLSLANVLIAKRRERGITQDELAVHVGVSKGSVSKWENGNSLPDIALLPIIASYFDISIDQLMSYSPQLSKGEIVKIYMKLAQGFAHRAFDEVLEECEGVIRKYYSCFELVKSMALLYLNHAPMGKAPEHLYERAIKLCEHILQHAQKPFILQEATALLALSHLGLGQADKVIELLCDEDGMPLQYGMGTNSSAVSQAHQMLGNMDKATEVEQIEVYYGLMSMFSGLLSYLQLSISDYETAKVIFDKAYALSREFNMRWLFANHVAGLYTLGARMHQKAGAVDETLDCLEKLVNLCVHEFFPVAVRGDEFFSRIDRMINQSEEKDFIPRDEATVKEHMLNDLLLDPAFEGLRGNERYDKLVDKMKKFVEGEL
ncbi:MAG: helix-turn-helix domain-containing protein [Defluviitaleaceae bacterium]|nr:helix-turn-helix domain-containing protein [Defluviitaleaceae bacterium]